MIHKRANDVEYCDCLDWNESIKQSQVKTMALFNKKLHTTGVTRQEREAWYINEGDRNKTPEQVKLAKELSKV